MKPFSTIASSVLAANIATAFPPNRNHIERFFENLRQQIKLRVDLAAYSSFKEPITTDDDPITQFNAPWGLARISHRQGVNVYVIGTGVNVDHVTFEGRAKWGTTIVSDSDDTDNIGTGTHYAGIIASNIYGVAKKANLIGVKTIGLNNPNVTDIVNGVKWAITDHQSNSKSLTYPDFKGSVIMLPVGGLGFDYDLNTVVDAADDAGIHVAVSAGNDNKDACKYGAGNVKALTVGASTLSDDRVYFSNYGRCIDLFAPGLNCLSAYFGSTTSIASHSGTEPAAAHVAGLLAYFVSLAPDGEASPESIRVQVLSQATWGILTELPDRTINSLAYNGASDPPT